MSFPTEPILVGGPGHSGEILIRGARVVDPRAGLDETRDVVIREGEIAELCEPGGGVSSGEVVEADGLMLTPAFVDPHVHLRVPGRQQAVAQVLVEGSTASAASSSPKALFACADSFSFLTSFILSHLLALLAFALTKINDFITFNIN